MSGLRLQPLLVLAAVTLVLTIVALSGVLQVLATTQEYRDSTREQTIRLQSQARESGGALARLVALTGARSMRDNDFGELVELAKSTVANDPNVLRTQIIDVDGNIVADTEPGQGQKSPRRPGKEQTSPAFYKGQQVFEYEVPIVFSDAPRGLVVVIYSLERLQSELQRLDAARRASIEKTTTRTVVLGVGFVLVGGLLAALGGRRVTRPLADLAEQATQLAAGNMSARVTVRGSGREVRWLAAVFNRLAEALEESVGFAAQRAGLEQEMGVARRVQETILPTLEPYQFGALRVAGMVVPANECGGDWWLRVPLDDNRIAVAIGDVTGHGMSTALIATSALSGFSAVVATHHPDHVDAELLLLALNETLLLVGHGEYQMSCAMMIFDVARSEVQFANGGHPFPCVFNRGSGQIGQAVARGPLVGKTERFEVSSVTLPLRPGDVYIWYSDGLLETRDAASQPYGVKRLSAAVLRSGTLPADQLRDAIVDDVRLFSGGLVQEDDLTVMVVEFTPG